MRFILAIVLVSVLFLIQYVVFTVGWGLTVNSWPVVILGFVIMVLLSGIAEVVKKL